MSVTARNITLYCKNTHPRTTKSYPKSLGVPLLYIFKSEKESSQANYLHVEMAEEGDERKITIYYMEI